MRINLFKFLALLPLILNGQSNSVFAFEPEVIRDDTIDHRDSHHEILAATSAPTTRAPTVRPTTRAPSKSPSNSPTLIPSTQAPTENEMCPSSSHSNCKLVSVSKCNVTAISIFSDSLGVASFGGMFSGSSLKSCVFKINCTISSLLANASLTNSFDNKTKPAPNTPVYIPTTKDSIPEGYDCKEKSSFNCSVAYLEMSPTPNDLPLSTTYILEGIGFLNCSATYYCNRVSPSCGHHSDNQLLGVAIEEI